MTDQKHPSKKPTLHISYSPTHRWAYQACARAAARLSSPSSWSKGAEARLPDGTPTTAADPNAVSWCILGALWAETVANSRYRPARRHGPDTYRQCCSIITEYLHDHPSNWNDAASTTHSDVINLLINIAKNIPS